MRRGRNLGEKEGRNEARKGGKRSKEGRKERRREGGREEGRKEGRKNDTKVNEKDIHLLLTVLYSTNIRRKTEERENERKREAACVFITSCAISNQ